MGSCDTRLKYGFKCVGVHRRPLQRTLPVLEQTLTVVLNTVFQMLVTARF